MKISWLLMIVGLILAFLLLAFVNKFELFGNSCYYFGSLGPTTYCIHPWAYYVAWIFPISFILAGLSGTRTSKMILIVVILTGIAAVILLAIGAYFWFPVHRSG